MAGRASGAVGQLQQLEARGDLGLPTPGAGACRRIHMAVDTPAPDDPVLPAVWLNLTEIMKFAILHYFARERPTTTFNLCPLHIVISPER